MQRHGMEQINFLKWCYQLIHCQIYSTW